MSSSHDQHYHECFSTEIESLRRLAAENPASIKIKQTGVEDITLLLIVGSYAAIGKSNPPFSAINNHEVHITFSPDYPATMRLEIQTIPPLFHPNLPPEGKWEVTGINPTDYMYQLWDYYTFSHVNEEAGRVKNHEALRWYKKKHFKPIPNKSLYPLRSLPAQQLTNSPLVLEGNAQNTLAENAQNVILETTDRSEARSSNVAVPPSSATQLVAQPESGTVIQRSSSVFRVKASRTTRPSEWRFPWETWDNSSRTHYNDWMYSVTRGGGSRGQRIKVVILQNALDSMFQHARGDMHNERFGILIGGLFSDPQTNETWVEIVAMLPAERVRANSASVEVSNEEISRLNSRVDEILAETQETVRKIGWYHTHPNHGIFMSGTDQTNQRLCYSADWQVAIVVDPIRKHYGAFHGAECNPLMDGLLVLSPWEAGELNTPAYRSWRQLEDHLAAPQRSLVPREPFFNNPPPQEVRNEESAQPPLQESLQTAQPVWKKAAVGILREIGKTVYHPPFTGLLIILMLLIIGYLLFSLIGSNILLMSTQNNLTQQTQSLNRSLQSKQHKLDEMQAQLQQSQQGQQDARQKLQNVQEDLFALATDPILDLKDKDPVVYRDILLKVVAIDHNTDSGGKASQLMQANLTYIIAAGDSFASIAQKFGVKIADLRRANPGVQPNNLKPGQSLTIPGVSV